jgi:hypothetical protein
MTRVDAFDAKLLAMELIENFKARSLTTVKVVQANM